MSCPIGACSTPHLRRFTGWHKGKVWEIAVLTGLKNYLWSQSYAIIVPQVLLLGRRGFDFILHF